MNSAVQYREQNRLRRPPGGRPCGWPARLLLGHVGERGGHVVRRHSPTLLRVAIGDKSFFSIPHPFTALCLSARKALTVAQRAAI